MEDLKCIDGLCSDQREDVCEEMLRWYELCDELYHIHKCEKWKGQCMRYINNQLDLSCNTVNNNECKMKTGYMPVESFIREEVMNNEKNKTESRKVYYQNKGHKVDNEFWRKVVTECETDICLYTHEYIESACEEFKEM